MRSIMLLLLVLPFLALATAAPAVNKKFAPNCDLVAVSYLTVLPTEDDNLTNVRFAWDRRNDNYAQINGTIKKFIIQHGPIIDGKLADEQGRVVFVEPEREDVITIRNAQKSQHYGIKICALTDVDEKIGDDFWDHAWLGEFDLSNEDEYYRKQKIDNNNSFLPRCNLVDVSGVLPIINPTSNTLDVYITWDKKQSSYETLKSVDHYRVRHGMQDSWGMLIKESEAIYFDSPGSEPFFTLRDVKEGHFWGVQICAMEESKNVEIDWDKEAWLGSMDLALYESDHEKATATESEISFEDK